MNRLIIMTFILIIGAVCTLWAQQEERITFTGSGIPLKTVVDSIVRSTSYRFAYDPGEVDLEQKKDVALSNAEIYRAMEMLFQGTDITYSVSGTQILLMKKSSISQKRRDAVNRPLGSTITYFDISGSVKDNLSVPLPGVTVYGASGAYTTSDINGEFLLSLPETDSVLTFFTPGFKTLEVPITDPESKRTYDVVLVEQVNTLDAVVLTGYQELKAERVTGAFENVGRDQLENRPFVGVLDRINGQVPGLSFNPVNGELQIRGQSSILMGSTHPLIVVDGFPLTDQENLGAINAEDIEDIYILKDAAAASVWGAGAGNGVIVIETRSGGNQGLQMEFSAFTDIEQKPDLDKFRWLSTSEEIALDLEFLEKGWADISSYVLQGRSLNSLHEAYVLREGLAPDGEVWSQTTFNNYLEELRLRNMNNDWEKYLLRNQFTQTLNFSAKGGTEKNNFYASLSYVDFLHREVGNERERLTATLKNQFEIYEGIRLSTGFAGILGSAEANGIPIDRLRRTQPYDRLVNDMGGYEQQYVNWNRWVSRDREALLDSPYTFNWVEEQKNRDHFSDSYDLRADISLEIPVGKQWLFRSSYRFEMGNSTDKEFRNMTLPSHRNFINDFYKNGTYQIPQGSDYTRREYNYEGWTFRNTLNFEKEWNNQKLNVFGGFEYQRRFRVTSLDRKLGYDKDTEDYVSIEEIGIDSGNLSDWQGNRFGYRERDYDFRSALDNRLVSTFVNAGYDISDKYLFSGTLRLDQANIYGNDPDIRYKPLWAVGFGWVMSEESFFENLNWADRIKIRMSAGTGGNTIYSLSPLPSARTASIGWGNFYRYNEYLEPGNPNLKWEETFTGNLGVDFSFFQGVLSGSFDGYYKRSRDVVGRRPLDPTNGFSLGLLNYASIRNTGFDLRLRATLVEANKFNWTAGVNFNYNHNKVEVIDTGNENLDFLTFGGSIERGQSIFGLRAYRFAGLDASGQVLVYNEDGNAQLWSEPLTQAALSFEGSREPPYYGGLSTTAQWGDLDLTVNLNYQFGNVFRYSYAYASQGYGQYNNTGNFAYNIRLHEIWADRWMEPGDEQFTQVPAVPFNGINPYTGRPESLRSAAVSHRIWSQSDFTTQPGGFVRVQDIIFGYRLQGSKMRIPAIDQVRFTLQFVNPFLWVENSIGADPLAPRGEAYSYLPRVIFGLRTKF